MIQVGLAGEMSIRAIARELGRPPSTVSREVSRNKRKRRAYDARHAQKRARRRRRRPQPRKLEADPRLASWVQARLRDRWSPEQIAGRMPRAFPHDRRMRISHETIYASLYVLARGQLKRELVGLLRTARVRRKPHGRVARTSGVQGMVNIGDPPAPDSVTITSPVSLSELKEQVTGDLASFGRTLLPGVVGGGALLVAIVTCLCAVPTSARAARWAPPAPPSVALVVLRTLFPALVGAAVGVAAGMAFTGRLGAVPPWEFTTATAVPALLAAVVAAVLPALYAATRDPVRVLRTP